MSPRIPTAVAPGALQRPQTPSLADLAVGATASVLAVELFDSLGDRLVELGLTPGAPVVVLRRGLWGGPVQVRVRDFALSLHRAQAAAVRVQAPQEAQGG